MSAGAEADGAIARDFLIVRRSMERMNGATGVESEPGKGSRFWIELPDAR